MIRINLIPDNLRRKRRKSFTLAGRNVRIPREMVIGLVGGLLVLLLGIHLLLQVFITFRYVNLKYREREWEKTSTSQTNVNRVLSELRRLQGNMKAVENIRGNGMVSWSEKLNRISDALPRGVWLDWISMDGKVLLIRGSSVSKDNAQIINVHNFTEELNKDERFMKGLKNIETGLIKSRQVNTTPVADFSISAQLEEDKK